MKLNRCTLDQIKKGTPSSYFSGNPLWGKAQKCKRVTVNEIHIIFCQEVYWQPGGKLSNDRSDADGNAHGGGNVTARLMVAIEKQLDISHECVRQ
jgi:hypothetical protein